MVDVVEIITDPPSVVEIVAVPANVVEVVSDGPAGPSGPTGPAGPVGPVGPVGPADTFRYVHTQLAPASVWTINHALGGYPAITVVDSAGSRVFGDDAYPTINQATVTFSSPFAGQAFLS